MSPITTRNPHTRTISVDGGRIVNMRVNGNGKDATGGPNNAGRVYPHLDELLSAKPDIDVNSPMRTILMTAESLVKQADSHLDFRRPDIALQEYVKASIITVEVIPRHKDFPTLKTDRGESNRRYTGLLNKINLQHKTFADVKENIKRNNIQHGVTRSVTDGLSQLKEGKIPTSLQASMDGVGKDQRKTVPSIQPKPDGLHGNSVHHPAGSSNVSDLAARFARLQNNGLGQDPRIKTRPISIPGPKPALPSKVESRSSMVRPLGPREPPSESKPQTRSNSIPLHVSIPGMPRPPDAIHHSPLRSIGNPDITSLPSSAARNPSFLGNGRPEVADPVSNVGPSRRTSLARYEQYESPMNMNDSKPTQSSTPKTGIALPRSSTISAEELMAYLGQGQQNLKLLLVDLRDRDSFESGHIMAQSIICVEPIILRSDMSGEELADSMVLAPSREQDLFSQRSGFDIVVFYDQASVSVKKSSVGGNREDRIIADFIAAVWDHSFEKRLQNRPVMLTGGLDAWVDLLGPNSLQSFTKDKLHMSTDNSMPRSVVATSTAINGGPQESNSLKRKSRSSLQSTRRGTPSDDSRVDTKVTMDKSIEPSLSTELVYARTTDDFFRRFPEIPESMISLPRKGAQQHPRVLDDLLPRAPARPPPALPRSRSSGIMDKSTNVHYAQSGGSSITNLTLVPGQCGLSNAGNLCYMLAAIQILSNAERIRTLLAGFESGTMPVPNAHSDPNVVNEQHMSRLLGKVLSALWSGIGKYVAPTTFAAYVNDRHCHGRQTTMSRDQLFGAKPKQHDSGEFLIWLMAILQDDLNETRDVVPPTISDQQRITWVTQPEAQSRSEAWNGILTHRNSFITREMGMLVSITSTCRECDRRERIYEEQSSIEVQLNLPQNRVPGITLLQALQSSFMRETVAGVQCAGCNKLVRKDRDYVIARLPDTLLIYLHRARSADDTTKIMTRPDYSEQMDFSSLCTSENGAAGEDPGFTGPFIYSAKAVTQHRGDATDRGHYVTYAKVPATQGGPPTSWHLFNDSVVTPSTFELSKGGTLTTLLFERNR